MLCRICGLRETVGRGAYCRRCLDGEIDGMNPEDVEAGAELLDRAVASADQKGGGRCRG